MKESLCKAIKEKCSAEKVLALLNTGADVNEVDDELGRTPLLLAIECLSASECERVVDILLGKGADAGVARNDGSTPLLYITQNSRGLPGDMCDRIAGKLLAHGADVNASLQNGKTPLSFAINNLAGQPNLVGRLILFGGKSKDISSINIVLERGLPLACLQAALHAGDDPTACQAFSRVDGYIKKRPNENKAVLLLLLQRFASKVSDQSIYASVNYGRDKILPKKGWIKTVLKAFIFPVIFCFRLMPGIVVAWQRKLAKRSNNSNYKETS